MTYDFGPDAFGTRGLAMLWLGVGIIEAARAHIDCTYPPDTLHDVDDAEGDEDCDEDCDEVYGEDYGDYGPEDYGDRDYIPERERPFDY